MAEMTIPQMAKTLGVSRADVCSYMQALVAELVRMPEAERGLTETIVRKAVLEVARKQRLLLEYVTVEIVRCKGTPVAEHPFMQMLAESVHGAFQELAQYNWEMENL